MRKSILLLAGAGIGAGFLYGFTRKGRGDGNGKPSEEGENSRTERTETNSGNGRTAGGRAASVAGENDSDRETRAGASMGRLADGTTVDFKIEAEPEIDDRGTDQHEASEILKSVRDGAFESSDEKLALALGRPVEEIEAWTNGSGTIDGDVVMKARTLAMQRGVEIQ
jgi:hypothetical protein